VSVDLCRQHGSRHCFFFFFSFFVRSSSSLHSAGLLLADLDLVFVKSVLPECFGSSFSRLLSLSLLLLLLWVLPTPPFPGGWSYCLVRIYRLSKSLFILFYLVGQKKEKKKSPSDLLNPRSHVISCYGLCRSLLLRHRKKS
jgi:hypothetical protein